MKLLVVLGSVREARAGQNVADWFLPIAKQYADVDYADLKEIDLPLSMEATIPGAQKEGSYELPQTKAWSERVEAADAVVFIHPEYNHSVSAALKNAIDHIYYEWKGKPLGLVGYGTHGANDAAEHLKWIGNFTKWEIVEPRVAIPKVWAAFDDQGALVNASEHEKNAIEMLTTLSSKV